MKIIDTHCDALYKLQMTKRKRNELLNYRNANELASNLDRLMSGGVFLQFFAVFIDPTIPEDERWAAACEQIELFHSEIIESNPEIKHILKWTDIEELGEGEIGAVLSLEGIEPIGEDLEKLRYLFEEGVLSVGLTWNKANLAADGALESYHGGLTSFGKEVIALNNEYKVLTDLSHLSEASFWDALHHALYPFASHSNARTVCDHPRNLSDFQLSALFSKAGMVNVTFYPPFIEEGYEQRKVSSHDLIRHIDYVCSIGGVEHIGFGSDFDGIDLFVHDLENAGDYDLFINKLASYFSTEEVYGFTSNNFLKFIDRVKEGAEQ